MERFLRCRLISYWAFCKFRHRLSLLISSLVALTLKHPVFTLVLCNARNLNIAWLACLGSSITFGWLGSNHFWGPFCRIVPFFHDIRLRNVVGFVLLILHPVLFINMLRERLVMGYCAFAIQEKTAIWIDKFALINRAIALRRFNRLLRCWSYCSWYYIITD